MMKKILTSIFIAFHGLVLIAQSDDDALFIKQLHSYALKEGKAYQWLDTLCLKAPGRIAGSKSSSIAEQYMLEVLQSLKPDTVFLEPCETKSWMRGSIEIVETIDQHGNRHELHTCALGNSIGTAGEMISGECVEVLSLDQVDSLGNSLKDKIVFFNRPMDPSLVNTFHAYGSAVDQRVWGASRAAKYGAKAVIVRSMTNKIDTVPHTGTLVYIDSLPKIPAMAISTLDAEKLSEKLKNENITINLASSAQPGAASVNYNVIAEWRGKQFPEEIILFGGHIDAWDMGAGAHDDGAGCIHAVDAINILLAQNYLPKRTLRVVLFANEENGLAGGKTYAENSNKRNEKHLAAIESDTGGFVPRALSFDSETSLLIDYMRYVNQWLPLFETYDLNFKQAGSGADINPLKSQGSLLIGLRVDPQKYFDFHHTKNDQIYNVNQRELELGAATMASIIYLLDKYGLETKN